MVAEAPTRNIAFSFPNRVESTDLEQNRVVAKGFFEYGPIGGRPESSDAYWIPVDWMAWKLLVDVLGVPPEKVK